MEREAYDWVDDAFEEPKRDSQSMGAKPSDDGSYDWIDDAFDEEKEDPLAGKGMTGCSNLAVLIAAIAVIAIIVIIALYALPFAYIIDPGGSL